MTRIKSFGRAHPVLVVAGAVLLVCVAGASWVAGSVLRVEPVVVDWEIPEAPQLEASGADQTVYRIDPFRSSASYEVEENLAGVSRTAEGTTKGIAGDILIDDADPSASVLGEIVVNLEQLESDQALRDDRIRAEYLESSRYPLARFVPTDVQGLPEEIVDGTEHELTVAGDLTVRDTTHPVTLDATVRRDDREVHVEASTTVKLSDFGVGPIRIIGLVSTGDEATLSFDLVAPEADTLNVEVRDAEAVEVRRADAGDPSFSDTVQPVLEQHCASCHEPGASGSGSWELVTAADAARVAPGLGLVVDTRYMPPWLASEDGVPLQHSMRLDDDQVGAVVKWARAGGPLDVDPDTRIEAKREPYVTPDVDLELTMPEPYVGTVDKKNDYRCFVLDPELEEPAVVTGYEFIPDQLPIVHHALVYRLTGEAEEALAEAEARDPEPGWECFGDIHVRGASASFTGRGRASELVMGWAPGQAPSDFGDGAGIHLEPGDVFVIQIHYHIEEDPPPDRSSLALELADGDAADLDRIEVTTYLAPAEIPCGPDESGPRCDREVELGVLGEKFGPVGPGIANGLHGVCGTTPEEIGRLVNGVASTSCDHRVRRSGEILAVLGHMHEIGKTFRMTLNPDTPDEKVLLDIPRWDFDWQLNYALEDEITIGPDDVIRVECSWDRALFPIDEEPHHVTWAEGTDDEMCYSTVATRSAAGAEDGP